MNKLIKNFFFDIFLWTYRVRYVRKTSEYTFDDVRVNVRCCFDIYVSNGFFTVHSEITFVVDGVSNIGIPET